MTAEPSIITPEIAATPFCKALRSRVYDPAEALQIAATHHRRAAELQGRNMDAHHNLLARVCEQHAADLVCKAGLDRGAVLLSGI